MKYVLILVLLCLSGCAGSKVVINYSECEQRGTIDGKLVADCPPFKL